jgi:hypothetical protein
LPPFVGVHQPEAASDNHTREMGLLCCYCRDGRAAYKIDGGWWHEVARGGEMGQYEGCSAHKLRNAEAQP